MDVLSFQARFQIPNRCEQYNLPILANLNIERMRVERFYLLLIILFIFSACQEQEGKEVKTQRTKSMDEFIRIPTEDGKVKSGDMAKIDFDHTEFSFDTILQGQSVEHVYPFTNTGKRDLMIADVTSSCGCTVPYFTEEPVPPGNTGEIRIVFDSEGKNGHQDKKIRIFANTFPNETVISIIGFVKEKENK